MITKRGVHKSSEQDLLQGRGIYVTEKDKSKYNWDEVPGGSKFIDETTGFEKVKIKEALIDKSTKKVLGYGVILGGKVYQADGATPIKKADWKQYLSSEVSYASSEDWVPTDRKYSGTICIAEDVMIIKESFVIINGRDSNNNVVYKNGNGETKSLPITAEGTSVFELSNTYTLGRNHLQVVINDARHASVVDDGLIELTANRFAVLEELHKGMTVTATYIHVVDVGNPYPRVFLTKNPPEDAESGDLWIDIDDFIDTDLGKFIDKKILDDEILDGGLQPKETHTPPNDVEVEVEKPKETPEPEKDVIKLTDSYYKMSAVFPDSYKDMEEIEKELDMSELTKTDRMFDGATHLKKVDFSYCDMKKVKSTSQMFYNSLFGSTATVSLANAELSSVENMSQMFFGCKAGIIDMSGTNTSKNKDMSYMFSCENAFAIMLSDFDTSSVTNMRNAFNCKKLKTLDLSSFNTSKVTSMFAMFEGCERLTSLDVSMFNTAKVTDMGSMFAGMKSITELDLSNFNTSKVTDMANMFSGCTKLEEIDCVFDMSSLSCPSGKENEPYAKNMFKNTAVELVKLKNVPQKFKSVLTKEYLGLSSDAVLKFL